MHDHDKSPPRGFAVGVERTRHNLRAQRNRRARDRQLLGSLGGFFHRIDCNTPTVVALLKANKPVSQRKQGPVATDTDTRASVELGSELTNEDVTGEDELTVTTLDSPILGIRVAAVAGTSLTFLMSHFFCLLSRRSGRP
ncbi:MAG: hypothetical protein ACI8RZ_003544, partial [Myxococcota bacterium]